MTAYIIKSPLDTVQYSSRQIELGKEVAESLKTYFSEHEPGEYSLAYSGGLDSSILAFLSGNRAHHFTVGSKDSKDFRNTKTGKEVLGIHTQEIHVEDIDLSKYILLLREIDPKINRRDIGYELVLAVLLDNVPDNSLMTGQGADELFYGYHRLKENPELSNEWHINKLIRETLPREKAIADYFGKNLVTPYLDSGIEQVLHSVTRDEHFSGETNKAILRCAAAYLGVPENLFTVRKTAAQYGSGIMKKLKASSLWSSLPESSSP